MKTTKTTKVEDANVQQTLARSAHGRADLTPKVQAATAYRSPQF
jgi:hypothetical protein